MSTKNELGTGQIIRAMNPKQKVNCCYNCPWCINTYCIIMYELTTPDYCCGCHPEVAKKNQKQVIDDLESEVKKLQELESDA